MTTNVGFLRRLLAHPDVAAGRLDTELVERIAADLLAGSGARRGAGGGRPARRACWPTPAGPGRRPLGPATAGGSTGPAAATHRMEVAGQVVDVAVDGRDRQRRRRPAPGRPELARPPGPGARGPTAASPPSTPGRADGDGLWLGRGGDAWALTRERETIDRTGPARAADGPVTSPMPGTVLAVHVDPGDDVSAPASPWWRWRP